MRIAFIGFLLLASGVGFAQSRTIKVAADGTGDFQTIQEAVTAVRTNSPERAIIQIKAGTYTGPIIVPKDKMKVSFEGESAETTIITYAFNVNDPIPQGSDRFNPGVQILGDEFRANKITFQNTSGNHGQALALKVDDDKSVFTDCRITGWQDTLMINNGRSYWKDCFISGRVDFIYGSGTAFFDHCEIQSRNGGHVTAASTPQDHPFGYVFNNCKLTADPTPWSWPTTNPTSQPVSDKPTPIADLGRPWRPYASVTYLNCEMGAHINPAGWNNWRSAENEKTARYSEYNSTGPGANPDKRFKWTKQLTKDEAGAITMSKVLAGSDNWNPLDE